jgi:uncharacterized protein YllA (UPF0747 family)
MTPRIVPTPLAPPTALATLRRGAVRRVSEALLGSSAAGPGRDRLAAGEALVVTTGQQPGLFTGPLYTIYKALSAIALAARLERAWGVPVVPVFWVAGDDHDFAEANHATVLNAAGVPVHIVLRERPPEAPAWTMARERCGPEIAQALERLRTETADSEFKAAVLAWLEASYTPDASLADAFAGALHALLGPRGLVISRPYLPAVKREMAPWLLRGLDLTLDDGLTPVLVEASLGRDRLRRDGNDFVTRRSGERFTRADLTRIADEAPERLSPNVLLRPVIEAALWPTVAYVAGPGELAYLSDTGPLYRALDVVPQTPVPRWSGVLVESRVEKVLEKHGLKPEDFAGPPGAVESRLVRDQLPADVAEALEGMQRELRTSYERLSGGVAKVDPTLERTVESARNAALSGMREIEKKLVASLKRTSDSLVGQVTRARSALYPDGAPQERTLTYASMAVRYGPELLDALMDEVARGTATS